MPRISYQNQADLILVANKKKPVAWFEIEKKKPLSKKEIEKVENALKKLKLPYQIQITRNRKTITCSVGKNRKHLQALLKAETKKNPKEKTKARGLALGYPKTAIAAFINKEVIEVKNLPKQIRESKEIKFLNFRISKKHWQKEFKVVQKRADTIKKLSPKLYKEITK